MNLKMFDILPSFVARLNSKRNVKEVKSFEKLNDKITFVFIDDLYTDRCLEIIKMYENNGIRNIKLFTSKSVKSPYVIKTDSIITKSQYSDFVLKRLNNYIGTEYVLINQWDGFIINFDQWSDDFFNYDYLGAPWWWKSDTIYGGNGGFSLRSKKLLNLTCTLGYDESIPEDEFICVKHLNELTQKGIKFANKEVSKRFSVENELSQKSFGFHNYNTQNIGPAKSFYKQKFHHSGDLGDIIYSLPFIKSMGGGMLIVSDDYHEMEIRCPMTLQKSQMLNQLLVGQDYIFDVQACPTKPSDIDIDLNQFRKVFLDWGNGKLNKEQEQLVKYQTLTQLYRDTLCSTIPKNFDSDPWLNYKQKIVISDKPIVINKTERYPRQGFPWKELVDCYGNKMIFVGTQHEYNQFIKKYGWVEFYHTQSFLTLAHIINGSKLFIGNQSFPYSLAEGMKINTIQETNNIVAPNCMYVRDNAYLTYDDSSLEFDKIKKFIEIYI